MARIQREALALHCLGLAGYQTYLPRLRVHKMVHGRRIELRSALFPGYAFVWIELQWQDWMSIMSVIGHLLMGLCTDQGGKPTAILGIGSVRRAGGTGFMATISRRYAGCRLTGTSRASPMARKPF